MRIYLTSDLDDYEDVVADEIVHLERIGSPDSPYPLVGAWVRGVDVSGRQDVEVLAAELMGGDLAIAAEEAEAQAGLFIWGDVQPETTLPCTIRVCPPVITRLVCTKAWAHNPNPTPLCTALLC